MITKYTLMSSINYPDYCDNYDNQMMIVNNNSRILSHNTKAKALKKESENQFC